MFFFFISLTIFYLTYSRFVEFALKDKYHSIFVFPIFLFIYLGMISTVLSFRNSITPINFIIFQLVIYITSLKTFKLSSNSNKFFLTIRKIFATRFPKNKVYLILFLPSALLLVTSLIYSFQIPLEDYVDYLYRASAPLHWVQNGSIFRFQTVDERKNILLMGSGLIYFWPNLFISGEKIAKLFYWTAFPLTCLLLFLFIKRFTDNIFKAIAGVSLFVSTPIIFNFFTTSLIQETWLSSLIISFVYFLIESIKEKTNRKYLLLGIVGVSFSLLIFIKISSVFLSLTLLIYLFEYPRLLWKNMSVVFGWFLIGGIFSGLFLLLYQNYMIYKNPFGSDELRNLAVSTDNTIQKYWTRTSRIPFVYMEFPTYSKNISSYLEGNLRELTTLVGADNTIINKSTGENEPYKYHLTPKQIHFSIGGLLILIAFVRIFLAKILKEKTLIRRDVGVILVLLFISLTMELNTFLWQESFILPYRHLLAYYSVLLAISLAVLPKPRNIIGKVFLAYVLVAIVTNSYNQIIYYSGLIKYYDKTQSLPSNREFEELTSMYSTINNKSDGKLNILLVENNNQVETLDYNLFWSGGHNINRVTLTDLSNLEKSTGVGKSCSEQSYDYIVFFNLDTESARKYLAESNYCSFSILGTEKYDFIEKVIPIFRKS